MRKRGLAGVVLAEHDALWDLEELSVLRRNLGSDQRLYRGVEISCAEGHVVVIGLQSLTGLAPGVAAATVVEVAHRAGAVVILAHPYQAVVGTVSPPVLESLPDGLDAVEVASSTTRGKDSMRALALARARGWRAVAGSDAHAIERLAAAYTLFPALPDDELQLAELIRAGRGRPCRSEKTVRSAVR